MLIRHAGQIARSSRRGFTSARLSWSYLLAALWALSACAAPADTAPVPHTEASLPKGTSAALATRPNIVFILTDDLNNDLYNRQAGLKSLLNEQGTEFRNHYVTISLCCPSRIATLRGQFAHNSGIFGNSGEFGGFEKIHNDGLENSTIATWLKDSGYRTALVGKYVNGFPGSVVPKTYIPPGWTRWFSPNGGSPYSEYNYDVNENGTTVHYGNAPEDYGVDVVSRQATTFIRNTTNNFPNKPFFLYVAPYVPHGPATPAPRHANEYPNAQAPRTPGFNEPNVGDKPNWVKNKALLTSAQISTLDALYRKRRQTLLAVEDLVRDVVNTLTETGQLNNTYIFFGSDNGFHQGQHRLTSGKNSAYDEDLRVPLIVRGPGVPAGKVVTKITANVDYASTWAELAGITPPASVDGRSLVPFLKNQSPTPWRQALLLEHAGPSITEASADGTLEPQDEFDVQAQASGAAPIFLGVRTATHTYVEYDTGERELYDNTTDPDQLSNSYSTAPAALKASLSSWIDNLRAASGGALRAAEEAAP